MALTDEVQDPLDRAMADTWVMSTHYKYDIDGDQDMFAERAKAISTNKIENTILLRRLTLLYKVYHLTKSVGYNSEAWLLATTDVASLWVPYNHHQLQLTYEMDFS